MQLNANQGAGDMTDTTLDELAKLREAVGMAYGYLWCVNAEPGTPVVLYPPERAAHEARKLLRDTMTQEQRGVFINRALLIVRGEAPCDCRHGECENQERRRCRIADEIGAARQTKP